MSAGNAAPVVAGIVTRIMREGGCYHQIKVTNVRRNKAGWSARATVTRADGASAIYRARISDLGGVPVKITLVT